MTLLILGLALWYIGHFWKRALPGRHAAMGEKAKAVSAGIILVGVVVMVIGYKAWESYDLFAYPTFFKHINNLAMLIAIYLMSPGPSKGAILYKMRHPMLTGMIVWAVAHMMVNPDPASYVLFGGLTVWAVAEMKVINAADPNWTPNPKGSIAKDAMFLVASVILLAVIGYIHGLIGPAPFGA
ncbi:NnrU family protein [Aliiroseovarius crassostreae]|uniref:NnrU family protein n=1 Tax=Aliiroseovarius crassostreae TaxID=154981 RepID=UPI0021F9A117|nr:NnrU family protein [Aliiroseovarius crassostreae]UWQ08528.1 NnrU family protein [Aliiroseovarius crassostreae]